MTTFADTLRALRRARKLTQKDLAAAADLTQSALSRYETGEDMPEVPSLLKLATGLQVPLENLVEGLDMRFDLMYQGLKVTATADDPESVIDAPTTPALDPSMDQVLRGFPLSTREEADDDSELAAAHASLQRAAADILSAARFLAPRPPSVARDLGPSLRHRTTRHGARPRPTHSKKSAQKRR